jgi:ABC-type glycerol-3-phosphate transport system permease component
MADLRDITTGAPGPGAPADGNGKTAPSAAPARPRQRVRWRRQVTPTILHIVLILGAIPILIPFYWVLLNSVQSKDKTDAYPPEWLPKTTQYFVSQGGEKREIYEPIKSANGRTQVRFIGENETRWVPDAAVLPPETKVQPNWGTYKSVLLKTGDTASEEVEGNRALTWKNVFGGESFGRYALNTLVIALLAVYGQIISCSLVAFGFARIKFWGSNVLFLLMLATMMIPGQIYAIPVFMIYRTLGWVDTYAPLIVPAWMGGAFFVFLFRQFFMGIPLEMDEAARMDGAGPFKIWWEILLPMAKPVAVVAGVYTFFGQWNDLFGPLIYLNSDYKRTLALALTKFKNAYGMTDVPSLMAASVLMMIPVLIIFFLSQKQLQQGMVVSGVKG